MAGTVSPSKYVSLQKLLDIRDNNYRGLGKNPKDYVASEVDALIYQKQTGKSEKAAADAIAERESQESEYDEYLRGLSLEEMSTSEYRDWYFLEHGKSPWSEDSCEGFRRAVIQTAIKRNQEDSRRPAKRRVKPLYNEEPELTEPEIELVEGFTSECPYTDDSEVDRWVWPDSFSTAESVYQIQLTDGRYFLVYHSEGTYQYQQTSRRYSSRELLETFNSIRYPEPPPVDTIREALLREVRDLQDRLHHESEAELMPEILDLKRRLEAFTGATIDTMRTKDPEGRTIVHLYLSSHYIQTRRIYCPYDYAEKFMDQFDFLPRDGRDGFNSKGLFYLWQINDTHGVVVTTDLNAEDYDRTFEEVA